MLWANQSFIKDSPRRHTWVQTGEKLLFHSHRVRNRYEDQFMKQTRQPAPKKQARRRSYETGQSSVISSMFSEPIIPRGHLQVCLLNSKHADSKICCFSRVIHSLWKTRKGQTAPPLPPTCKNPWAACSSFAIPIHLFRVGTERWLAASQRWPLSQRWTSSSCTWRYRSFRSSPSSPHLSLTESVAHVWSQTSPWHRLTQSRKEERWEEPF